MKIISVLILVLFLGCGGGGGSSNDDKGTNPVINSVEFCQWNEPGICTDTTTFVVGDKFTIRIVATDPDLDMEKLFIEVRSVDHVTPYEYALGSAPSETVRIEIYQIDAKGFVKYFGNHSVHFWIVDKQGNESEEYLKPFTINDY